MKHVIKVQSLQNLPETRPLVAMDNNGNLGWRPNTVILEMWLSSNDGGWEDQFINYEEGMTWGQWQASNYNPNGVVDTNLTCYNVKLYQYNPYQRVLTTDLIDQNNEYAFED